MSPLLRNKQKKKKKCFSFSKRMIADPKFGSGAKKKHMLCVSFSSVPKTLFLCDRNLWNLTAKLQTV